jgi:hypothetical protein
VAAATIHLLPLLEHVLVFLFGAATVLLVAFIVVGGTAIVVSDPGEVAAQAIVALLVVGFFVGIYLLFKLHVVSLT